jgi:hypothetical protein
MFIFIALVVVRVVLTLHDDEWYDQLEETAKNRTSFFIGVVLYFVSSDPFEDFSLFFTCHPFLSHLAQKRYHFQTLEGNLTKDRRKMPSNFKPKLKNDQYLFS